MTEKQYPELPESGSGRNMTMAAFLRQPPNVKEPIYMAALDKAAIEQQRIIDADRAMRGVEPAPREPLTSREVELLDGMIEVQLHHANRCDNIGNRLMAEKQKAWNMERVELLKKLKNDYAPREQSND